MGGLRARSLFFYFVLILLGGYTLLMLSSCEESSVPPEEPADIQLITDQDSYNVGEAIQSTLINDTEDTLWICACCDDHYVEALLDGEWVRSNDFYASCDDPFTSIRIEPGRCIEFPDIHTGYGDLCRQVPGQFRLRTRIFKDRQLKWELPGQVPMSTPFSVRGSADTDQRYVTDFSWYQFRVPPGCQSGVFADVSEKGHLRIRGCYRTSACLFVWLGATKVTADSVCFEVNLNYPKPLELNCFGLQYSIDLGYLCAGDYIAIVRYTSWQGNSGSSSGTWIGWQDTVRVD